MGIIKKVAVVGAMAAVGALAANRKAIKKAVRNMIGSGKEAMHTVTDKADELAARADKSLANGEKISGKLKRIDDFNISIWTLSGEYSSWRRDAVKVQILDPLQGHRDLLPKYTNTDMHNVLAYLETLK